MAVVVAARKAEEIREIFYDTPSGEWVCARLL